MSYLCQVGVIDFVSEIKPVENYPDFDKIGAHNLAWFTAFVVQNIDNE